MTELRKFWLTVMFFGALAVACGYVGTRYALEWGLLREAQSRGLDWANHVEKQLFKMNGMTRPDGSIDPNQVPDPDEFQELLSDVASVGHIFQFDYINVNCLCHVSLNYQASPDGGEPEFHHPDDGHDHGDNTVAITQTEPVMAGNLTKGFLKHVIRSRKSHAPPKHATSDPLIYHLDRELVHNLLAGTAPNILIREGTSEFQPDAFAETYHVTEAGGEAQYVIRALVDLEDQMTRYKQFLYSATIISALLMVLAVGYPAFRYVRAVQRERKTEKRAAFLANFDVLTQLHNRNHFQETAEDILWTCHEKGHSALLFLFDLNGFKEINDTYGHHAGDEILCEFAKLLTAHVPENGYVARLGGDEFVAMIGGIDGDDISFRDHLDLPNALTMGLGQDNGSVTVGIAGGVTQYPRDAETLAELLQLADLALYAAKPVRSGEIRIFEPALKQAFQDKLSGREDFRDALASGQIVPYYQPIIQLDTGQIIGFEALARWLHPTRGILSPAAFAAALDEDDLSAQLGEVMFDQISSDMRQWQDAGVLFGYVGLNITDGDLKRPNFAQHILDGLAAQALSPNQLALEVTENCLFRISTPGAITELEALNKAGCHIALDDFGTGYSSITQLKEMPVTTVKIDKSFIDHILTNEDDQSIVQAMWDLGQSMKFSLVVEGVETADQVEFLEQMGFAAAQGFYFCRPIPPGDVPAFVHGRFCATTQTANILKLG